MTELELAAYHEAGHVVIARAYGVRVIGAAIHGEGHGHVAHQRCGPELELRVALAGVEAEARRAGVETWCEGFTSTTHVSRSGDDLTRVLELTDGDVERLREALDDLRECLSDTWADVEREAAELLDRG